MISFDGLALTEGSPIYLQIIAHIKRGLVAGAVRDGEELPSRRTLSALLGVNPNTVQKAYRILEEEGLATSRAGAKSYVTVDDPRLARIREELLEEAARPAVAAFRQMGLTREAALALVGRLWDAETEVEP